MSIASPASETARASRMPGGQRRPVHARLASACALIALGALLAACGSSGGGSSTTSASASATTGASASATTGASATATSAPNATPLPTASHVSPADTAGLCGGSFGPNAPSVYAFSKSVYAETAFALSYPSYTLPANTTQAPFKLGNSLDSLALKQVFGGDANANPAISQLGGILFSVCNNGSSSITLAGVGVGIITVAPHASPINTWQMCDGAYQPGIGVTGGGCGGAVAADEVMRATFSPSAGQGAAVGATQISANGPSGYGPFPVTLKPGHTIQITIAITMPSAPGIYTLALTLAGTGVSNTRYAPLTPQLFAPVAHKWNGESCKASAMLSQIPASATSSYFICPV